jgi:periplasmic divalent cation tolerance protein
VVSDKLAACVNITDVHSIYRWQGKVEKAGEKLLIIKTLKSHFSELERLIKANHSYDNPEIIAFDISAVSSDYAEWVKNSVK